MWKTSGRVRSGNRRGRIYRRPARRAHRARDRVRGVAGTGAPASMSLPPPEPLAARRFPVRVRIAHPTGGFGPRLDDMNAWLDANCGADGWIITPAGLRGVVNDAVAIYFRDAALAAGFVARWCRQRLPELTDGAFVMRDDEPIPSHAAPLH